MDTAKSVVRFRWAAIIVLLSLAVSGCVPIRMEAVWPVLSPAQDGQGIFVAYDNQVVMLDVKDGRPARLRNADGEIRLDDGGNARIWQFTGPQEGSNQFYSSPILTDVQSLLIPTRNGQLYEVDPATVRVLNGEGTALSGLVSGSGIINDGVLYIGVGRDLMAIDTQNQQELWRIETDQSVWSQPLVADGVLYFTSLDHHLYAVDAESGVVTWKLDLEGAVPDAPVLYEGRLYAGSFSRKVFEISLDGEILSSYDTDNWIWGQPAVVDGMLYIGDLSGVVYALKLTPEGFELAWRSKVSDKAVRMTPLVTDEYIVVGSRDNRIHWLDPEDGTIVFTRDVAGEVLSDLLLVEPGEGVDIPEPYVIVATMANEDFVVAFKLSNGERAWPNSYTR